MKIELSKLIGFNLGDHNADDYVAFIVHLMRFYKRRLLLPREFVAQLLEHSMEHQRTLSNVITVNRLRSQDGEGNVFESNVTIVGDLHGQFNDFEKIFQEAGFPSTQNQFIFNGDMVDRGPMGVEIVVVLLVCKLLCPESVHILRGNHETLTMTKNYGFEAEVLRKYNADLLGTFRRFFDTLPLAAVVQDAIFVTHGGIGPTVANMTIQDLKGFDRFIDPEDASAHKAHDELLWSDPMDGITGTCRSFREAAFFCFGPDITEAFLTRNNLSLLIRSHELKENGYAKCHNDKCWTVFSAPNYCGTNKNLGALIRFVETDTMEPSIIQFTSAGATKWSSR